MAALTKAQLGQVQTLVDSTVDAVLAEMYVYAKSNTGASVAEVVLEVMRRRSENTDG